MQWCAWQANSPYGTLVVEDRQAGIKEYPRLLPPSPISAAHQVSANTGMSQTLQEALLNYQLKACTGLPSLHLAQLSPERSKAPFQQRSCRLG